MVYSHLPSDEDVVKALWSGVGLVKGSAVRDSVQIQHHHVGIGAAAEVPFVGEPQLGGGHGGHFVHCLVQTETSASDVIAHKTGKGARCPGMSLAVVHEAVAGQHDVGVEEGHVHVLRLHHMGRR